MAERGRRKSKAIAQSLAYELICTSEGDPRGPNKKKAETRERSAPETF